MFRRLRGDLADEKGAILIIVAASMFFLLGMAAIAVDLSALRSDIRTDTLVADSAVTAGVASIDPFSGNDAEIGCQVAWEYVLLNLEDEGGSLTAPNCAALSVACSTSSTAVTVGGNAGPYSVEITHPIPDGNPLLGSQTINSVIDGVSCQRMAVAVTRNRAHWFARVMGFNSGDTRVVSVARNAPGFGAGEIVPLLVLEPISCDALYTSGQGKVTVSYEDPDTPGFIVVDSNGSSCGPNSWTIDAKGVQNGWIRAIPHPSGIPSAILSYALSGSSGANAAKSYDPGDLVTPVNPADITDATEPAVSHFRLYPRPSFVSRRITRAAIDHRYNCKAAYPDYLGMVPISPCLGAPAPHIDNLRAAYGSSGPALPIGFNTWSSSHPCNVNSGTITVTGNWYVDCGGPNGFVVNGATVEFVNGDVVFAGNVEVRSSGVLRVNPGPVSDHVVVLRDGANNAMRGNLTKVAQATIELRQTFVYLEAGKIDLVGGAGGLTWTAPIAGNFEDLALWSEAPELHQIGGQAGNTLEGTFFTPYALPFSLTGQAGQFQTNAQFITRRLEVGGQGEVKMHPDPDRTTKIPIREVRLIR